MDDRPILTVSQLNEHIKGLVDGDWFLANVYVRGELSNYKQYASGHHYFSIKDADSSLRCVMFRSAAQSLRFRPENGMKVIAFGRVSVYVRDGGYQLYCGSLTPDGVGDLAVAFQQLKERLGQEGLFDPAHKKPLPRYPRRIGVVTSGSGAAVHDIIRVLRKRWPLGKVLLLPVRVQGVEAPPEIAGAIRYANRHQLCDVLIVGRGGGSMEDLWCFNDERVARAIFASAIPIISAVGHEPDVTIADFVADLRAATPSNGAELCAPDGQELMEALDASLLRAESAMDKQLKVARQRLDNAAGKRVLQDPKNLVEDRRTALTHLSQRLAAATGESIARQRQRFAAHAGKLDALSPLKVLGRGYAIALTDAGKAVTDQAQVSPGDTLTLRLHKGSLAVEVKE